MASFADRFKDKAQIVGKTGEGAMLVQNTNANQPPKSSAANARKTSSSGGTNTPPLSGNRVHRSMLPTGAQQPVVSSNYRDHVRGLAGGGGGTNSTDIQTQGAALSARDRVPRSRSGQPYLHNNTLAEKPLGPMLFGQNKYRSKDEFVPNQPVPADKPKIEANYVPYSVNDWRENKDKLAVVKGGVGRLPADTDEQRLYRALRGRMKDFSEETEAINKVALLPENLPRPPKPLTPPPSDELLEKTQRRQKAVEFAKHVPKPKVISQSTLNTPRDVAPEDDPTFSDERRMKEAELANLEEQHRRDQEAIAAMKKRFAM